MVNFILKFNINIESVYYLRKVCNFWYVILSRKINFSKVSYFIIKRESLVYIVFGF